MLKTRTASEWSGILVECGVQFATAARWAPAFSVQLVDNALSAGEVELDDFLGQVLHESSYLERVTENLNYRVTALMAMFPNRITAAEAYRVGRVEGKQEADQEAIANIIYGGAWGAKNLGNTKPGDGWTYRGRGPIQITGRHNYDVLGRALDIDLLDSPGKLASDPRVALRVTLKWWEQNLPDSIMDGNIPAVTKRINGGYIGLDERKRLTEAAGRALAR